MSVFNARGHEFLLDAQPVRLLAGTIPYARVAPAGWRERLLKLKACGLNAVETGIPWNVHEPRPGQFCWEGEADVVEFVRLAAALDLFVLLRAGPSIGAEWDLGGLPAWLLADPTMRLRCSHPPFLLAVDRYFDALLPRLAPLQVSRGGPVVAVQVEHEYGSYGNDKAYLRHLVHGLRARGMEVLLLTADEGAEPMLEDGAVFDVLQTVRVGVDPRRACAALERRQPQAPLLCGLAGGAATERTGNASEATAGPLQAVLAAGASAILCRFDGGMSFGLAAPVPDSGPGAAPDEMPAAGDTLLDAGGAPTATFFACREVIARSLPVPPVQLQPPVPRRAFGSVPLRLRAELFAALPHLAEAVSRAGPEPMERFGQAHGFILYRTTVHGPRPRLPLVVRELHDRAELFINGEPRALIAGGPDAAVEIELGPGPHQLDLLVESTGRVGFGPRAHERKGISESVRLGETFLFGWQTWPLPLSDLSRVPFLEGGAGTGPAFFRGLLQVDEPADTFLALPGWGRGVSFLNGVCLGRHGGPEPRQALYVPAHALRAGYNDLVVFELQGAGAAHAEFLAAP